MRILVDERGQKDLKAPAVLKHFVIISTSATGLY